MTETERWMKANGISVTVVGGGVLSSAELDDREKSVLGKLPDIGDYIKESERLKTVRNTEDGVTTK